jgi:hypothetical protein
MTVSMMREVFSRLIALARLTLAGVVGELNATLRRKEEARIYHWQQRTGAYPPRRMGDRDQGGEATPCIVEAHTPGDPRPPPSRRTGETRKRSCASSTHDVTRAHRAAPNSYSRISSTVAVRPGRRKGQE